MEQMKNDFMPAGLPLLADHALIHTLVDYRHAYRMLARSATRYALAMRAQMSDAMRAIERELCLRGLSRYTDPLPG